MNKSIRFVGGLLLTLLFAGLFVADGLALSGGNGCSQGFIFPFPWNMIKGATAHYDRFGNLTGCYGAPKDCIIFVVGSQKIAMTTDDVALVD